MVVSIVENKMANLKIAVLLATFNRKNSTLACLKSLFNQELPQGVSIEVFVTDDSSSDGTPEAIRNIYSQIHVFKGNGSLFWAGGMRNSWREALAVHADHFLLLNDDTELEALALSKLLGYYQLTDHQSPAICIGSTQDRANSSISYGGQKLYHRQKAQFHSIYSDTDYLECDLANANIMLVHRSVVEKIGILSDKYTHSIADFDYTIRARKAGFKAVLIPGVLGYCTDDHGKNWKSAATGLRERIKYLKSPKGLAYTEYLQFIRWHFPMYLPAAFFKLWLKTLFPIVWEKLK